MKKLSRKWKIIITTVVILLGGFYSYYKANNRNAFEEMYNSYYNILPLRTVDNMPVVEPIPKDNRHADIVKLYYREIQNDIKIEFSLVKFSNEESILLIGSTFIEEEVYLDVSYVYDMSTHKLKNSVTFRGEKVPLTNDKPKQRRELLEKYNISKEQLQKISDEGLDKVLTDWKNYSGSSYSKDNMGRLTIEKDEFLK